jgi:DNA-binding transcriptional ArsR family regulator
MSNSSDIADAPTPGRPGPFVRPVADAEEADTCQVFSTDGHRIAHVGARLMAEETVASLAETFRALGDPTRVRILDALAQAELCVCEIATLVGLSESAVSHQLRLLRSLRIVRSRRRGRMVFYALDDHHVRDLFAGALRHVEEPREATLARAMPARS